MSDYRYHSKVKAGKSIHRAFHLGIFAIASTVAVPFLAGSLLHRRFGWESWLGLFLLLVAVAGSIILHRKGLWIEATVSPERVEVGYWGIHRDIPLADIIAVEDASPKSIGDYRLKYHRGDSLVLASGDALVAIRTNNYQNHIIGVASVEDFQTAFRGCWMGRDGDPQGELDLP